ncbi:phasin family protein [Methylobacterium sp. NEAU 140]|uniref:phasin family protein n=1 Tax=Methylobacterium sp. NEAU 140 TaxID=3064945 RepID=UPI002733DC23|nr:phasin family protein [Methylobacterium sp. NEAU 140]MDP4026090.1 phasin family protein [Methylobacterium sp. NEAU 140]
MENDNLPAVSSEAGRRMAESGVARAREAYERYAEAGEQALNAFETSMAQSFEGWRQVMGSTREAAVQLADSNVAGARKAREQWEGAAAKLYNACEDNAGLMLAAMREIAHRVLVASDTNVRASLDFAERLAQARDPKEAMALQASFLQEQSRRLTDQMVDLHRTTTRLAREAAAHAEAP